MKTHRTILVARCCTMLAITAFADGVLEPRLILYGKVRNAEAATR